MVRSKVIFFFLVLSLIFSKSLFAEKGGREIKSQAKKREIVKKSQKIQKNNFYILLDIGVLFPSGLEGSFGFDLRGGYEIPIKSLNLRTGLRMGFYRGSEEGSVDEPAIGGKMPYKLTVSGVPLFLEGILIFNVNKIIKPFIGIGSGITYIKSEENFFGYSNEETKWNSGVEFPAGSFFHIKSFELLFELRYTLLPVDFVTTGSTDLTGFGIFTGGGFRF